MCNPKIYLIWSVSSFFEAYLPFKLTLLGLILLRFTLAGDQKYEMAKWGMVINPPGFFW